jgi:hypothetical protein
MLPEHHAAKLSQSQSRRMRHQKTPRKKMLQKIQRQVFLNHMIMISKTQHLRLSISHHQSKPQSRVKDAPLNHAQPQEHHAANLQEPQNPSHQLLVRDQMQDLTPHSNSHHQQAATLDLVHLLLPAVNFQDKQELTTTPQLPQVVSIKNQMQDLTPHSNNHHQLAATLKLAQLQEIAASFQDRLVLIMTPQPAQVVFIKCQILANTH